MLRKTGNTAEDTVELENITITEANKFDRGNGQTTFIVPKDYRFETVGVDKSEPWKLSGTAALKDAPSFVDFVNKYKQDHTAIFCDREQLTYTAIVDFHEPSKPRFNDFKTTLKLEHTEYWAAWVDKNEEQMTQEEFAEFLEDRLYEIAKPDSADLLEIITNLKAKNEVQFEKAIRLQDGQNQLVYREQLNASAQTTKGTVAIPEKFIIIVEPFPGYEPVEIEARLRYRIRDGRLSLYYVLGNLERIIDKVFTNMSKEISDRTTLTVYSGSFGR